MSPEAKKEYNRLYGLRNRDRIREQRRARVLSDGGTVRRVRRASMARTKYGMTIGEYETMIEHGCEICGVKGGFGSGRMAIDHDHSTGKIRGALCSACNLALGKFRDSPEVLRQALRYLGEWA